MNYTDLLHEVLVERKVLGVGSGSTGAEVKSVWGSPPLEDVDKRRRWSRWDYGLTEFLFRPEDDWICTGFLIQLHRLAGSGAAIVPRVVSSSYGEFPDAIYFDDLLGLDLVNPERDFSSVGDFVSYEVPRSRIRVNVLGDSWKSVDSGRVWSISAW